MEITKLDAAVAQMRTAIRLYFEDQDPISVQTLVCAAGEIVSRMCAVRGNPSIRDRLLNHCLPDGRKVTGELLNTARNFFKHGAAGVLENFNDEWNYVTMIMVVDSMIRILDVRSTGIVVWAYWMHLIQEDLVKNLNFRDIEPVAKDYILLLHRLPRADQKKFGKMMLDAFKDHSELPIK